MYPIEYAASDRLRQRLELIGALTPSLMEAHLRMGVIVFLGPVAYARGIACFAVLILESNDRRHEGLATRDPVAGISIGEHQFLVGHDFQVSSGAGDFLAIRCPHYYEV